MSTPKEYLIIWTIDLTAHSPKDAARQALNLQRDVSSLAVVFEVDGEEIDLSDEHDIWDGGTFEENLTKLEQREG